MMKGGNNPGVGSLTTIQPFSIYKTVADIGDVTAGDKTFLEAEFNRGVIALVLVTPSTLKRWTDPGTTVFEWVDFTSIVCLDTSQVVLLKGDQTIENIKTFDSIRFNKTATPTMAVGDMAWDNTDDTAKVKVSTNVELQLGQEDLLKARNVSGSQITDGKAVFIKAASGSRASVDLASNDNVTNSCCTLAISTETINNDAIGFYTRGGLVRGLNTNSWNEGDTLYLGTSGALTNVIPDKPNRIVRIGYVIKKDTTTGQVFVDIHPIGYLSELCDVITSTPAADEILKHDGTTWVNGYIGNSAIKFTPEGGLAVKLINKTGVASVKGTVVHPSAVTGGFTAVPINDPDVIGVVYDNGIADGGDTWVVISGIAQVLFIGNTTIGHLARTFLTSDVGGVAGKALSEAIPTSPFATDKHFCEIGHVIESRVGAGLAKVVLHFN